MSPHGEMRELRTIAAAVALLDEWASAYDELERAHQHLADRLAEAQADVERLRWLVERLEVPTPEQLAERFAYPAETEEAQVNPFA